MAKQMGKKNRKNYKYTKHEFISICCSKCRICYDGFSPDFCYSDLYIIQPKKFIKIIFRNLLETKHLIIENEKYNSYIYGGIKKPSYDNNLKALFVKVFCSADLCGRYNSLKQCTNINMCLLDFKCQMNGCSIPNKVSVFNKQTKEQRYIVQPYPTFFTNDNEQFSKEIKKIIATGK